MYLSQLCSAVNKSQKPAEMARGYLDFFQLFLSKQYLNVQYENEWKKKQFLNSNVSDYTENVSDCTEYMSSSTENVQDCTECVQLHWKCARLHPMALFKKLYWTPPYASNVMAAYSYILDKLLAIPTFIDNTIVFWVLQLEFPWRHHLFVMTAQ